MRCGNAPLTPGTRDDGICLNPRRTAERKEMRNNRRISLEIIINFSFYIHIITWCRISSIVRMVPGSITTHILHFSLCCTTLSIGPGRGSLSVPTIGILLIRCSKLSQNTHPHRKLSQKNHYDVGKLVGKRCRG